MDYAIRINEIDLLLDDVTILCKVYNAVDKPVSRYVVDGAGLQRLRSAELIRIRHDQLILTEFGVAMLLFDFTTYAIQFNLGRGYTRKTTLETVFDCL